jgi:hypothetical protein
LYREGHAQNVVDIPVDPEGTLERPSLFKTSSQRLFSNLSSGHSQQNSRAVHLSNASTSHRQMGSDCEAYWHASAEFIVA